MAADPKPPHPQWDIDTRTIREWVRGECVNTAYLLRELKLWVAYLEDEPRGD